MTTPNGLLLIDKPRGITSHDVVAKVRRALKERRVGHAGTLDPMATGLLVIGVGPATRLLRFAQGQDKVYTGTVQFGIATDSLDADGAVIATQLVPALTTEAVASAAATLTGPLMQIPPMVSAIKVGGKRLHELAREGVEVERAPRSIVINSFTLTPTADNAVWDFEVGCSVGTYVRVLLADLAVALGTVGHLTALRRERSGTHTAAEALSLDELAQRAGAGDDVVQPPRAFVEHLPTYEASEENLLRLRRGQRLSFDLPGATGDIAVVDRRGHLAGIVHPREDGFQPDLVLPEVLA
jgi:tRNA pseudouridine55 synthase